MERLDRTPRVKVLAHTLRLGRSDLLALAALAVVVLVFFWPVILGRAWIPAGGGDLVSFIYPMYRFAAQSLQSGQVPLWNPYLYAGSPLISDNQSGLFYPFNLLLFLLNPGFSYQAVEGLVIWHIFFAGAAMYFCLRWLYLTDPLSRPAALLGALTFMLSGVYVTHTGNLNLIAVAAWLPLTFVSLHRAVVASGYRGRLAWSLAGGLGLGFATLAGHGQMTFLLALILALYALHQTALCRRFWAFPNLVLLAIVALGLASISLIPSLGSLPHTVRAGFDTSRAVNFSLPWSGLLGLAAPDFYGRGIHRFWGPWPRVEYGYAGILPWMLAVPGLVSLPSRQRWFYPLAGLLFLLLALGSNTPLYPLLLRWLPNFPFQAPARFVLLVDFCLAVLAAAGLHGLAQSKFAARLARAVPAGAAIAVLPIGLVLVFQARSLATGWPDRQPQMERAILGFIALAAAGWLLITARLRHRLKPQYFVSLAVVLLAIDLVAMGRNVEIEPNDPTLGYPTNSPALEFLHGDPGLHRVDIAAAAWQPSLPQLEKLYAIGGVYNPLVLANYSVYVGSVGYRGSPLYNLLGVKYVVADKDQPPGDTTFLIPVFDADPDVDVYLNTRALPRVLLLYNAEVVADHDTAFVAVHDETFDPQQTLILIGGRPLEQEPGHGLITVTSYELNSASFEVSLDRPAYFLLSDIYHSDWKAEVDDQPATILVGDYAFRALLLEPGTHRVTFWYDPPGWRIGLVITLLTGIALAVVGAWLWWGWKDA